MIKYKLICKNCDLSFDSWFSSSVEYDRLKKKNYINCHSCNSLKVEKSFDIQTSTKENLEKQAQDMLREGTIFDAFKLLLAIDLMNIK